MKPAFLILAIATTASLSLASAFTSLCDTGVITGCATQTLLSGMNQTDGNYTVTVSPVGTPPFAAETIGYNGAAVDYFTVSTNTIGTTTADWITAFVNGGDATATGTYNYQQVLTANVTGLVTLTGEWAVDNCGTIAWGATPTPVSGGTGTTIGGGVGNCMTSNSTFDALTSFSFQESVVSGTTYYLDFEVGNTGSVTALLADDLAASGGASGSVPEPSSILLMLTGMAVLGAGVRRAHLG